MAVPIKNRGSRVQIGTLEVSVYTIPTDTPESDGTLEWDRTTMVLVRVQAAGEQGIGYSYASSGAAVIIREILEEQVVGNDALDVPWAWDRMVRSVRNQGRPGLCSCAIAAVDSALWDLKARVLKMPLAKLLGMAHEDVSVYGSGGFTSYDARRLQEQLSGWVENGIRSVKMKVGRDPAADADRVRLARKAISDSPALFVDANGAYHTKQALDMASRFDEYNVSWFEEPVSSDDLEGLHLVRNRAPRGMVIAAGEYGYDLPYFRRMLQAEAVDTLQADATRCAGITGFLKAAALAESWNLELSAHTAPSLHLHACCAIPNIHSIEYFHDHVRIESMLFDGFRRPVNGRISPDMTRTGMGLELRKTDAARYAA